MVKMVEAVVHGKDAFPEGQRCTLAYEADTIKL